MMPGSTSPFFEQPHPYVAAWVAAGAGDDLTTAQVRKFSRQFWKWEVDGTLAHILRLTFPCGTTLAKTLTPLINTKGASNDSANGDLTHGDYSLSTGYSGFNRSGNGIRTGAAYSTNELGGAFAWTAGATNDWYFSGDRSVLGGSNERSLIGLSSPSLVRSWGSSAGSATVAVGINGFNHLEVSGASASKIFQNGSAILTSAATNLGTATSDYGFGGLWLSYLGSPTFGGPLSFGSSARLLCWGLTDGVMSDPQALSLYTGLAALMALIGRS